MAILGMPALCPAHPFFPKIARRIDIPYEYPNLSLLAMIII
jgi:hypothetical protein